MAERPACDGVVPGSIPGLAFSFSSYKGHTDYVWSVAYSPDGQFIVSGSGDCTIRIWDAKTGAPVGKPLKGHIGYVWSVAYSPNGQYIVSGSGDNTIQLWDSDLHVSVQSSTSFNPMYPELAAHLKLMTQKN